MKRFLLRSFGAVLSVICLPVASLHAQGALAGLNTDVVPENLAHLPGDAGIGTSVILIRRGTGFAPPPSSQPVISAQSAFFASTGKGVTVRNLPSLTTVIILPPARVRRPTGIFIRRSTGFSRWPSSQRASSARRAFFARTHKGVTVRNLRSLTTVITLPPARLRRPTGIFIRRGVRY